LDICQILLEFEASVIAVFVLEYLLSARQCDCWMLLATSNIELNLLHIYNH